MKEVRGEPVTQYLKGRFLQFWEGQQTTLAEMPQVLRQSLGAKLGMSRDPLRELMLYYPPAGKQGKRASKRHSKRKKSETQEGV